MSMKRKIGIGLLCLVLVIGGGGLWLYQYLFHNLDEETKERIDAEIGSITSDVQQQIREKKEQLEQGETSEGDTPDSDASNNESGELSEEASQVITNNTESLNQKTTALLNIYYSGMKELEGQGNAIVNQLLSNAKKDYQNVKSSGGGKTELLSLASAYSNQASAMESGLDASVEGLLSELRSDLVEEGVSASDADAIISQLRSEYKNKKQTRYNEVYAQFQAVLK